MKNTNDLSAKHHSILYFCLDNSLNASRRGWRSPMKETLLGPKRLWNSPITFRSNRVKKATESSKSRQCKSQHKTSIKEY